MAGKGCRHLDNVVDMDVGEIQFFRSPTVKGAYREIPSGASGLHIIGPVTHHGALLWAKLVPHLTEHHGFCLAAAFWYTDEIKKIPDAGIRQDKFGIPGWSIAADTEMPIVGGKCPNNIRNTRIQLSLSVHIMSLQGVKFLIEFICWFPEMQALYPGFPLFACLADKASQEIVAGL